MEAYEKACQYVRFQGPSHIGGIQEEKKRGSKSKRPAIPRKDRILSLVVGTASDWGKYFLPRVMALWIGIIASPQISNLGVDSWPLEGETLYLWSDRKFSRVEMPAWLFCRDGLGRRFSMHCISLDFRRNKESKSEAKSWLSRCGLSRNFWDRTVQVNWVERWVFGSVQVKAKIIYD